MFTFPEFCFANTELTSCIGLMAKSHLLTPEQLKQFKEEGYLIVPSFFSSTRNFHVSALLFSQDLLRG